MGEIKTDYQPNAPKAADGGGLRFNTGKNKIELTPTEWIWGLSMVTTRGSFKYAERNWERGMKWSYLIGCAFRHLIKFMCGERYDKETGCHHMFMAAWNCCALASYDIRGIGENDLGEADVKWLEWVAIEPGPELAAIMKAKLAQVGTPRTGKVNVSKETRLVRHSRHSNRRTRNKRKGLAA